MNHVSETNDLVMLMGILDRFGIEELLSVYQKTIDAYLEYRKPNALLKQVLLDTSFQLLSVQRRIADKIKAIEKEE